MDQKAAQLNKAVRARRGDKSGAGLGLCRWRVGAFAVVWEHHRDPADVVLTRPAERSRSSRARCTAEER
jgi:hypothetical protein